MSQKRPKTKKAGENQDAIDQLFLGGEVHENGGDQAGLERRHEHGDRDVGLLRSEIDIGESDGDAR